jgi:predicted GTPase
VLIATPIDLGRLIDIRQPSQRVRYALQVIGQPTLRELLEKKLGASLT